MLTAEIIAGRARELTIERRTEIEAQEVAEKLRWANEEKERKIRVQQEAADYQAIRPFLMEKALAEYPLRFNPLRQVMNEHFKDVMLDLRNLCFPEAKFFVLDCCDQLYGQRSPNIYHHDLLMVWGGDADDPDNMIAIQVIGTDELRGKNEIAREIEPEISVFMKEGARVFMEGVMLSYMYETVQSDFQDMTSALEDYQVLDEHSFYGFNSWGAPGVRYHMDAAIPLHQISSNPDIIGEKLAKVLSDLEMRVSK